MQPTDNSSNRSNTNQQQTQSSASTSSRTELLSIVEYINTNNDNSLLPYLDSRSSTPTPQSRSELNLNVNMKFSIEVHNNTKSLSNYPNWKFNKPDPEINDYTNTINKQILDYIKSNSIFKPDSQGYFLDD